MPFCFALRAKILLTIFAFGILVKTFAQGGLAAYSDFRDRFYIFDHGKKTLAEQQPVKSFKVGGNHIAYVDYADNFKVYSNGEIKKVELGTIKNYYASDYMVVYTMLDMLKVYDKGRSRTLSTALKEVSVGDSLIVFFDKFYNTINGYYNGKTYSRKIRLVSSEVKIFEAKRNIGAALITEDQTFFVFYRGQSQLINELVTNMRYDLGRDIMAYIDRPTQSFKAYYKGEIYDVESFIPSSFKAGDGRVAYIDNVGNFKTFYDGTIAMIASTQPMFYEVKDSMIVYGEVNRLKCFYQGRITEIVPYIPKKYVFARNQVLFVDNNGNVSLYRNGETRVIYMGGTASMINDIKLERDVVVLNVNVNKTIIIYQGVTYQ